jgi:hypothetical protein
MSAQFGMRVTLKRRCLLHGRAGGGTALVPGDRGTRAVTPSGGPGGGRGAAVGRLSGGSSAGDEGFLYFWAGGFL